MGNGIVTMTIIGARVATSVDAKKNAKKMTYHPTFVNGKGKDVSSRLTIPVLVNLKGQEVPSNMLITAWGGMADVCAKALSPGREINMIVEPRQYTTVYKVKGQPVLINNEPLNITGYSYNLKEISFGTESASFIANEIARGLRGSNWFKPGSDDQLALNERRKQINATEYTANSPSFGYAVVANTGETTATTPVAPVAPAAPTAPAVSPTLPTGGFTPEMLAAAMAAMQQTTAAPASVAPPMGTPVTATTIF